MTRGTTPVFELTLPFDVGRIAIGYITIKQKKIVIEKSLENCECNGRIINMSLTQEDTLSFTAHIPAKIQIRCRMTDGSAWASEEVCVEVKDVLKDGVI